VKNRKSRVQRMEVELRQARREIKRLNEIAEFHADTLVILGDTLTSQGNLLSILSHTVKTDIARVSNSVRVTNIWQKALQCRIYKLEQGGFWKWLFGRKYRRKIKTAGEVVKDA